MATSPGGASSASADPPYVKQIGVVDGSVAACGTLLIYDLLCTFDQEVAYVWTGTWSLGTILFFLNRYLPFIDTFISLSLFLTVRTPQECLTRFTVVTWFIVSGVLLSEVILCLRTYAIWERKRSILITLCITGVLTYIPAIYFTQKELESLKYVPTTGVGCALGAASPIIIISYILLVLSETVIAALTGIKAYRHLRHSRSRWVRQLYKEGLLFYFYLLAVSLANVLIPILAPPEFANWLATPQRVLHSVLCTRVLLLIRRQKSSTMTARLPVRQAPSAGSALVFTSFLDEGVSANLTIAGPSVGESSAAFSSEGTSSRPGQLQSIEIS